MFCTTQVGDTTGCDSRHLTAFIDKWLGTLFITSGRKKLLRPPAEWNHLWPHMYQTFPDAMLMQQRGQGVSMDDFQFAGRKVYFLAWEVFFPRELCAAAVSKGLGELSMPICPGCRKALSCNGWAAAARRIVTAEGDNYLYFRNYRCRPCKRKPLHVCVQCVARRRMAACAAAMRITHAHAAWCVTHAHAASTCASAICLMEHLQLAGPLHAPHLTVLSLLPLTPASGNFVAHHAELVELLPDRLRLAVPCALTHRNAMDLGVKLIMDRNVINGQSFTDFRESVHESRMVHALRRALQCVSAPQALSLRGPMDRVPGVRPMAAGPPLPLPTTALMPSTPGGHYFSQLFQHSSQGQRRQCFQELLASTPAVHHVLKFDHCHKPAKSMRMPVRIGHGNTGHCPIFHSTAHASPPQN